MFLCLIFSIFISSYASSLGKFEFYDGAYETGKFMAKSIKFSEAIGSQKYPSCTSKISTKLEEGLDKAEVKFREDILETIGNDRKFVKMCSIYQNYKNDIDKCVSTDSVTISGVINLLKLICDIKINSIAKNTECLHDMETRLKSACRISCLAEMSKKSEMKFKQEDMNCHLAFCVSKCINFQVRECSEEEPIKQLYNEISGSQMLIGLEKMLGVGAPQIYELIDSDEDKFPQKCHGLIRKSLEVTIRASEHEIPKVREEIGLEKEAGRPF